MRGRRVDELFPSSSRKEQEGTSQLLCCHTTREDKQTMCELVLQAPLAPLGEIPQGLKQRPGGGVCAASPVCSLEVHGKLDNLGLGHDLMEASNRAAFVLAARIILHFLNTSPLSS